ncbi:MAG: RNA methyltransferase [Gemmatimonadales bacterium]|nr:RNA methyltransferase [Gemmatimonadales bacterium]MYG47779.1 RNA methyltransferase [Gemmatimonadales bacterium]MYK01169.1 RNA methyltransferase [Candidatus Palauibacter ramosifaciens]
MPTRAEIKAWRSLHRGKGRRETGCFLAEGRRLIAEMLEWPGRTVAVLYAGAAEDEPELEALLARAAARDVRTEAVPEAIIRTLADAATPQPVLAIGELPAYGWADVGDGAIVLLDGVQDPGNVGVMVRSALALGAAAVIGVGETADPWGPKALRASAGASFRGPVFRTDTRDAVERLAGLRIPIWVAAADAPPLEGPPPGSVALVLGSEARGVSAPLLTAAARAVSVPLSRGVESLNVASAGAILLDRLRTARPLG